MNKAMIRGGHVIEAIHFPGPKKRGELAWVRCRCQWEVTGDTEAVAAQYSEHVAKMRGEPS